MKNKTRPLRHLLISILILSLFLTGAKPHPFRDPDAPAVYTASINVVGDLMVHQWQLDHAYNNETDSYDFDYCFENIREYLSDADYTIGNLETVLADRELGISDFPLFGAPDSFALALKNAGFDLLTTANNHCLDKKKAGVLRTIDVLEELGLEHIGTYKSQEDRDSMLVNEINGIRFVFLAYTYGTNGLKIPSDSPYLVNLLDEELIRSDIARAKSLNPDFIIVLPHMGEEYRDKPGKRETTWVSMMLDAGADVVLASHPHVLQPAEYIKITDPSGQERNCFAAYSLGNFVSSQRTLPRDAGVILRLDFQKTEGQKAKLTSVSYTSTWVAFVNAKGSYDIKVLHVNDTLDAYYDGEDVKLRKKDIQRLEDVRKEADAIFRGQLIPAA